MILNNGHIDDSWDVDAARGCWQNVDSMATYIQDQKWTYVSPNDDRLGEPLFNVDHLTIEQQPICDLYVEMYQKILQGEPVILTFFNIDGMAGSRKMFLIYTICHTLQQLANEYDTPNPICVLAPSSVTTLNGGGQTMHSTLALPTMGSFFPLTSS